MDNLLSRLVKQITQRTGPAIIIAAGAMLLGFVLGQSWLVLFGSMGLWFTLYPGLSGAARKPRMFDPAAAAKQATVPALGKSGTATRPVLYGQTLNHALYMKSQIEIAVNEISDARARHAGKEAIRGLPELVESLYRLAELAENTASSLSSVTSQIDIEMGRLQSALDSTVDSAMKINYQAELTELAKSRSTFNPTVARLRRWDAQLDHAMGLFDLLLVQVRSARTAKEPAARQFFAEWPQTLKREATRLRSEDGKSPGQILT